MMPLKKRGKIITNNFARNTNFTNNKMYNLKSNTVFRDFELDSMNLCILVCVYIIHALYRNHKMLS